jgi:hypothetical protein
MYSYSAPPKVDKLTWRGEINEKKIKEAKKGSEFSYIYSENVGYYCKFLLELSLALPLTRKTLKR